MPKQAGFTLIEVMVAILLMAIVSVISWRGLDSVSRSASHLEDAAEHQAQLLRAINQLQQDLAMRASIELAEPGYPGSDEPTVHHPLPAVSIAGSDTQSMRINLVRSAAHSSHLQRVRWWFKNNTLYRAAAAPRGRYPLPVPGKGVAVLDNLRDVQIRIWRNGKGWERLSGKRTENPLGLELTFTRRTDRGDERYRQVFGPLDWAMNAASTD